MEKNTGVCVCVPLNSRKFYHWNRAYVILFDFKVVKLVTVFIDNFVIFTYRSPGYGL